MASERRTPGPALTLTLIGAGVFVLWTVATLTGGLAGIDLGGERNPPDAASGLGQILAAFAILTWPGVPFAAVLGMGVWAYRRRLRNLAIACALTVALTWGLSAALQIVFQRPRPEGSLDLITSGGWSYPAGHLAAIAALAVIVVAATAATRQSPRTRVLWGVVCGLVVVAVGINQWLIQAHRISDIIGGVLLGLTTSGLALAVTRVRVEPQAKRLTASRTCAVIVNPTKVEDWASLRRHLDHEAGATGWQPVWLETTTDDLGDEVTQQALSMGAELVIAAGGDGTVRQVCKALSGTGVPLGILPLGTGNLLAHNLGIPVDEGDALAVIFGGISRSIDLIELRIDDNPPEVSAVMAGMGFDAEIMNATNSDLKKLVGPAAYFLAAPQALATEPFECRVELEAADSSHSLEMAVSLALIGNVSRITGQIDLLPDARPDDGVLDLILASPKNVTDWARIAASVISGASDPAEMARATGTAIQIEVLGEPVEFQIDGDTAGKCRRIRAEVVPNTLSVMVPRQ